MKRIMSVLAALMMVFALVSVCVAATNSPGHFPTGTPYPCGVESPAYPDYTDARPAPCDKDAVSRPSVPVYMGSPGI
jgi:hypothetical protein